MPPKHEHRFRTTTHLDGCHYYVSIGVCACRASVTVSNERSFKGDPYSYVWAEPAYEWRNRDERGRFCKPYQTEVICARCAELKAGAPCKRTVVILAKDGSVEYESESEYEQTEPEEEEE